MEKERKKQKKKTFWVLLSICALSFLISVLCMIITIVCFVRLDKRMESVESLLVVNPSETHSSESDKETYTINEVKENLEYKTIEIKGIQVTYPCSGTIGEKGFYRTEYDTNEYYLDIESFEFTEPSGVQAYSGSTISYKIEFIGTDYWGYEPTVKYKEYDAEGFFIAEKIGYLGHGGIGEHVKLSGLVELDGNAEKVIVELIP